MSEEEYFTFSTEESEKLEVQRLAVSAKGNKAVFPFDGSRKMQSVSKERRTTQML